jgi:tRNA modification GTPase
LDTLVVYGARLAEPGEFSKRAFLNGKIDLTKAEAIAKLIESKSTDAAKILARQLKGELGEFINQSRDALLKASAYSEVLIDYAEEDIPQDISAQLLSQLEGLSDKFDTIVSSSQRRRGLIDGFRVAIVGKPNVGKSSLLNAFLSYDRAIVSDIAGTTRDTIEEQVTIGSHIIRLIDTAGIRDKASDQIEEIGIARSKSAIEDADIIIALFDGSAIFDEQDRSILDLVERYHDKDTIIAINKSDLIQQIDREIFGSYQTIDISAKHNFEILLEELLTKLDSIGSSDELMLISARQIEAVKRSTVEIHNAKEPLSRGELEFFSYHLMEAIKHLSSITTPYNNEEILDKMFGEFCLGK